MKDINQKIKDLPKDIQEGIMHIEHSWKTEGYELTNEDKERLYRIATKKSTAQEEVQELLKKFQSGGEIKWVMTTLQMKKEKTFLI